jgi:RNA polymerase sigma factor (sigma-70 family)
MIARALTMLSDERLAQLAAGGSDPAFATLYSRYSGTLFAYCRSITRNADDGWDALQNAMIKVLVALRRAPERSAPVRPWLFCICHNESIGVLRRRTSAERVANAATWVVAAGADEQALLREHVTETVSDVQQLPTGQRAALVMRELADLRYDEIALALETTEGNARQLVFAARAGLRDSRAGRGLPCESVRDQLSLADGRLLRRRSVRAHLRTCDGCREYAVSMRRQPVRGLAAWSPLAGYQLLESVFRAAAASPAAVQGGSSLFGPLAVKAATVGAVVATGLGAADVATRQPERSPAPGRAAAASASGSAKAAPGPRATTSTRPASGTVKTVPAVSHVAAAPRPVAFHTTPVVAKRNSSPSLRSAPPAHHDSSTTTRPAQPDPPRDEPRREQRVPAPAPARAQADCDTGGGAGRQQPVHEEPAQTRQVALSGNPRQQPAHDDRGFAGAR